MSHSDTLSQRHNITAADQPIWVLLNGWGSNHALWQGLIAHLPGDKRFIDLPDHDDSLSGQLSPARSWQGWAEFIAEQMPANCILIGWSLGGMLATQVAALVPKRVRALITLACNPCFVAKDDWPDAMAVDVFTRFCADFEVQPAKTWSRFCALQAQGDSARKDVLQRLKLPGPPSPKVALGWANQLQWLAQIDNREVLKRLSCPHLHLYGEGDGLVPASVVGAVASFGHADTHIFPNIGHAPHISDPKAVSARVLLWLQSARGISKAKIARSFAAAAVTYDASAHVQLHVAQQLVNELSDFAGHEQVLDLGCGTGFVAHALQLREHAPQVTLADLAEPMVAFAKSKLPSMHGVVADAEALPFATASFDAVVSSLALQWCHDLVSVGREVERCLRSGGAFTFSTLGPATLHELKRAWAQVDDYVHVNTFKSTEQIRSELCQSGLLIESIRQMPVTLRYPQVLPLLRELKAIGAHNMNPGQKPGLSRRSQLRRLEHAYAAEADESGLLPVTYDVLIVTAIKS